MSQLSFNDRVELFKRTAVDPQARAEFAASRAEVILPLINEMSTVRSIFKPIRLAPGAELRFDIPFEDIDVVYTMPQIGSVPTAQFEGKEIRIDTFGIDGGVEYQIDMAKDGRFDVANLSTNLLRNNFIRQEELAGWTMIKAHAAVLPSNQKITALDNDGGTSGTKRLNIHTLNKVITTADQLGIGGRKVTDIFCSPLRFGDLRTQVAIFGLPENIRNQMWGNGQGVDDVANIRIHRVYRSTLVDDTKVYAFTQKEGFTYGLMPIREELQTIDNPIAILEWKIGILARARQGFGIQDNLGLIEVSGF